MYALKSISKCNSIFIFKYGVPMPRLKSSFSSFCFYMGNSVIENQTENSVSPFHFFILEPSLVFRQQLCPHLSLPSTTVVFFYNCNLLCLCQPAAVKLVMFIAISQQFQTFLPLILGVLRVHFLYVQEHLHSPGLILICQTG